MNPNLSYYSQNLSDEIAPKYGDQLEALFAIEKWQLIGAIGAWVAHCIENPESEWQSLGDYAEDIGAVGTNFDAWDIVQHDCNFTEPQYAMPLLKALIAQLDQEIYLR